MLERYNSRGTIGLLLMLGNSLVLRKQLNNVSLKISIRYLRMSGETLSGFYILKSGNDTSSALKVVNCNMNRLFFDDQVRVEPTKLWARTTYLKSLCDI